MLICQFASSCKEDRGTFMSFTGRSRFVVSRPPAHLYQIQRPAHLPVWRDFFSGVRGLISH